MDGDEFATRYAGLTRRQRECLQLRCEGLQNAEIADRTFTSRQVVRNHITAVFRAMGMEAISRRTGGLGGGSRSALVCYNLGALDQRRVMDE